jgi:hypothetical protein
MPPDKADAGRISGVSAECFPRCREKIQIGAAICGLFRAADRRADCTASVL